MFFTIYRKLSPSKRRMICLVLRFFRVPLGYFYKQLKFEGIFKIRVDKNQHFQMIHYGGEIENETFWKGLFTTWEPETGWIWKELCHASNVILDVGANTGIYSLTAYSVNPNAKVYAFEPSLRLIQKLKKNMEMNNFPIVCEQLGVSDTSGEKVFYDLPFQNDTGASLSPDKMKNWAGYTGVVVEYSINTISLQDYIKKENLPSVDLIKIDIEMHEPEAIEGLGEYLLKYKPVIIFEILSDDVANKLLQLIDLKDYCLFHLKKNGIAEQKSSFNISRNSIIDKEWNYLIFHKDLQDKIRKHTSLYSNIVY